MLVLGCHGAVSNQADASPLSALQVILGATTVERIGSVRSPRRPRQRLRPRLELDAGCSPDITAEPLDRSGQHVSAAPEMAQPRHRRQRGRSATALSLRLLAAVLAGLLGLSSLGEIAHFLLVPHAICADHGELIEVSGHAAQHAEAPSPEPQVAPLSDEGAGHDHCDLLASQQRPLALPAIAPVAIVPASAGTLIAIAGGQTSLWPLPPLALAPKTSPPSAQA